VRKVNVSQETKIKPMNLVR